MNLAKHKESNECVVIGLGQLGQLYGGAALRLGMRVTPVTRKQSVAEICSNVPEMTPIIVAVGEGALEEVARAVPSSRYQDLVLVQNEIFRETMAQIGLADATFSTVWLSKKKQRPIEIARSSCAFGPHAAWFRQVHEVLDLPMDIAENPGMIDLELISKYTFILTINVLGLVKNVTLGQWLNEDPHQVDQISADALRLAEAYAQQKVSGEDVQRIVKEAMQGLANYPARGRTAQQRLDKAMKDARQFQVELPGIEALDLSAAR